MKNERIQGKQTAQLNGDEGGVKTETKLMLFGMFLQDICPLLLTCVCMFGFKAERSPLTLIQRTYSHTPCMLNYSGCIHHHTDT